MPRFIVAHTRTTSGVELPILIITSAAPQFWPPLRAASELLHHCPISSWSQCPSNESGGSEPLGTTRGRAGETKLLHRWVERPILIEIKTTSRLLDIMASCQ
jgi:hypothetical protein